MEFDEEKHEYSINGNKIPSVTQILEIITNSKYSDVPETILDVAADKGTEVHLACEVFNKTGYMGVSEEYKGYIEAYQKWIKDMQIDRTKIQSEVRTYHKALYYAGTVDMIYDNKIVIDIKTCSSVDIKTTAVQTSAYAKALESNGYKIENCYILWLSKDGNYKYIKLDEKFNIFLSCLSIYNYYK